MLGLAQLYCVTFTRQVPFSEAGSDVCAAAGSVIVSSIAPDRTAADARAKFPQTFDFIEFSWAEFGPAGPELWMR
jgi:hypothetical protein